MLCLVCVCVFVCLFLWCFKVCACLCAWRGRAVLGRKGGACVLLILWVCLVWVCLCVFSFVCFEGPGRGTLLLFSPPKINIQSRTPPPPHPNLSHPSRIPHPSCQSWTPPDGDDDHEQHHGGLLGGAFVLLDSLLEEGRGENSIDLKYVHTCI